MSGRMIPGAIAYRPADAAAILGVSRSTIYDMIAAGKLAARKLGTATVIGAADVERLLPPPVSQSVVYFLGYNRYVKIGYATNLAARVSSIQTCVPVKLTLYYSMPGGIEEEKKLHLRFKRHRLSGEWFHYGRAIKNWIAQEMAMRGAA